MHGNSKTADTTYNLRLQPASFSIPGVMPKMYDYYADGPLSSPAIRQASKESVKTTRPGHFPLAGFELTIYAGFQVTTEDWVQRQAEVFQV